MGVLQALCPHPGGGRNLYQVDCKLLTVSCHVAKLPSIFAYCRCIYESNKYNLGLYALIGRPLEFRRVNEVAFDKKLQFRM